MIPDACKFTGESRRIDRALSIADPLLLVVEVEVEALKRGGGATLEVVDAYVLDEALEAPGEKLLELARRGWQDREDDRKGRNRLPLADHVEEDLEALSLELEGLTVDEDTGLGLTADEVLEQAGADLEDEVPVPAMPAPKVDPDLPDGELAYDADDEDQDVELPEPGAGVDQAIAEHFAAAEDLLVGKVGDVKGRLSEVTDAGVLRTARDLEEQGKNRKGVLEALDVREGELFSDFDTVDAPGLPDADLEVPADEELSE